MALGLGAAVVVGVALGMLGGGGSILAVPVFVYLLGYGAKVAIAMSLAVVGTISLVGVAGHLRSGNVDLRIAGIFGVVAMIGTYLGALLAAFVSDSFQLVLFAGVMGVAAVLMLRRGGVGPVAVGLDAGSRSRAHDSGSRGGKRRLPLPAVVLDGLGVGVLTGLVGVGGGFLIVPVLVLFGGLSMKKAVGTSLLVISMKSFAGLAGYLGIVDLPWSFVAAFTAVAAVGILLGTALTSYVPERALTRSFAGLLIVMSAVILYENRSLFVGGASGVDAPTVDTAAYHR